MILEMLEQNSDALPYYLLLFVRMSGLFLLSPIFGRKNVPALLKLGFCLVLTILLASTGPVDRVVPDTGIFGLAIAILLELAVGLSLGFLVTLFFSVSLIAGQIIDVEMGLGIGGVFDPQMGTQTAVSGMLLNLLMILYFLINNGHLKMIRILGASVERVPVGQARLLPDLAILTAEQFGMCFGLAFSLMLPLIGSALLTETGLGLLMRAIPQLNAYMVGIELKVLVGLFVLYLMQPIYVTFCDLVFEKIFLASEQWVSIMGVGA